MRDGGSLTITGGSLAGSYGVTGGASGGGGATGGQAQGTVMFLHGTGTTAFNVASGTQTLAGADALAGTGGLAKSGAGTLALTGANANYTGAVSVTGGLISFATGGLGSGTISLNGGGLQWGTANTSDISGQLAALGASGGTFDTNGNNVAFATGLGGGGGLAKAGAGTLTLDGINSYTGVTTVSAGTLALGNGVISNSSLVTVNGGATFDISASASPFVQITTLAGGGTVQLGGHVMFIFNGSTEFSGTIADGGSFGSLVVDSGTQTLSGINTYTGLTGIGPGATLALKGAGSIATSAQVNFSPGGPGQVGTFDISQTTTGATIAGLFDVAQVGVVSLGGKTLTLTDTIGGFSFNGVIQDGGIGGGTGGSVVLAPNAIHDLAGVNTYTGSTTLMAGATLTLSGNGSIARSSVVNLAGAGATFDISGGNASQTIRDLAGVAGSTVALGGTALTLGTANSTSFAGTIADGGLSGGSGASLVKVGTGTLTLGGANTYTGGTTINAGLINFSALNNFGTGTVTLNGGGLQWAAGNTIDISSSSRLVLGAAGGTFDTNGNNITFATGLTGAGGITKQGGGILNLAGANTYTGPTSVTGGTLAVNGSITSNVTVGSAGTLGGNGTIFGNVVNAGTLAPGNSIGTLNITGNFVQSAGSFYQVEANAAGQADRVNATGTATIQGGTVQVIAAPGVYAPSTTYTILRATGGVSGVYSGVTSNFAFLTPTLSYDANDVFLTLSIGQTAFTPSFVALTPNQRAVGVALNQSVANASGDFATVIGVLAGLSTAQGPLALDTISGQPYADFGTLNTNSSMMFMNALGQQMANARGVPAAGQRQALAQACEIESCDAVGPLSAWASALGGLGSVLGDTNASTLTYNFGGAAAGIDYRFDPRFLAGIGVGYTHGTQWVNTFMGQGWSDSVSVAAYGSFTQAGFYVDALAGYAYFNNQLQRQILIPGLQQRTATGCDRCQPVPRPDRGRLQGRHLRAGDRPPSRRSAASRSRARRRTRSRSRARSRSTSTSRSRPPTRSAPPSAPISAARSASATSASSTSRSASAGCTSSPTSRGRSRRPSPARRATPSPCSAPRPCATPPWSVSRPSPPSPPRRRSTCATTARSPPAPTTTRSTSACA